MKGCCPLCLKENIVAIIDGPTCKHSPKSGLAWWPEGWDKMPDAERIKWLEARQEFSPD